MHDIFFFIFAAITILTVFLIVFSTEGKNTITYFIYFIVVQCGLLIISNAQLIPLLVTLILLIISFTSYLYKEKFTEPFYSGTISSRVNVFPLLTISLFAAITASLLGTARWKMFNIDPVYNSYTLIFTKYLPIILSVSVLISVITPAFIRILKVNEADF